MKLDDNHIAFRFLTDDSLAWEIVDEIHPNLYEVGEDDPVHKAAAILYNCVNFKGQRAYYITETVISKLDLLKVKKIAIGKVKKFFSDDIIAEVPTYDWSIFNSLSSRKVTFIFPNNQVLRLVIDDDVLWFANIEYTQFNKPQPGVLQGRPRMLEGSMHWDMFYINKKNGALSENWQAKEIQKIENFIYRVMCFFYMSENTEEIVQPGHRHGTRKAGKLVNALPVPITVVTSKWNITSIRTEGFNVSGHFRMQPYKTGTKMIWIDPFQKHGYVRHAKKEDEL